MSNARLVMSPATATSFVVAAVVHEAGEALDLAGLRAAAAVAAEVVALDEDLDPAFPFDLLDRSWPAVNTRPWKLQERRESRREEDLTSFRAAIGPRSCRGGTRDG